MPVLFGLVVWLVGWSLTPHSVLAEDKFKWGELTVPREMKHKGFNWRRMHIHPGLGLGFKYNDNVFLEADKRFTDGSSEGAASDMIYTISPGLVIEQPKEVGDYFGFEFSYLGEDEHFVDLTEQNKFNHYLSGYLNFGNSLDTLIWKIGGQFVDTRTPISTEFAANLNPRIDRTNLIFDTGLWWAITPNMEAKIEGHFSRNLFDLDSFDNQEFETYDAEGTLLWKATALTGFAVNYNYQITDFFNESAINDDSKSQSVSAGMLWNPLSVLNAQLWLGFNNMRFENVGEQNRNDLIYRVQLDYQPKITRHWTFTTFREIRNSYFRDVLSYQKTVTQMTLEQKLGVKWSVKSRLKYQVNRYDVAAIDTQGGGGLKFRKDHRFSGLVALTYSIQEWLDVSMEYKYVVNSSNFDNTDYENNIFFLQLRIFL